MTHAQVDHDELAGVADRWVRVGNSDDTDSQRAGVRATTEAVGGGDARLLLVFAGHFHDHERLLAGVTSVAPTGSAVVGCTTETVSAGTASDGVVVMAIGGPGIAVATRRADIVGGDPRTAGEAVARVIGDIEDRGHTVVVVLSGGSAGDQQEVLQGAHGSLGDATPLVGGCTGVDVGGTALFHATSDATSIGSGQVIGVAISSTEPIGIGVESGWAPVDPPHDPAGAAPDRLDASRMEAADIACRDALCAVGGSPMGVVVLGGGAPRLEERLGAPVAGCVTRRQFARVTGASGVRDHSAVALAIG